MKNASKGSPNWMTYGYDSQLDYLTSASYDDGHTNANPTWTYDAALNRTDSVCDNLNRTTSIGGVATTCDILGNRLTFGSKSYGWDCLNRMVTYNSDSYVYRADAMRIAKTVPSTSTTTYYRYDGQMGFEDLDVTGSSTVVNDYGLGARGVDYIAKTASGTTTVGYPIYDAHGNMTGCLFRSGTYYSLGNQRSYDAWCAVRQGLPTGDPKARYCASLGHKQDDESGLVYMRARNYDVSCGRFVSQDSKRNGSNWFIYCRDDPVNSVDRTGTFAIPWLGDLITGGVLILLAIVAYVEDWEVSAEPIVLGALVVEVEISTGVIVGALAILGIACLVAGALAGFKMLDGINGLPAMMERFEPQLLAGINDLKTYGNLAEKLAACDIEDEYWCMVALAG